MVVRRVSRWWVVVAVVACTAVVAAPAAAGEDQAGAEPEIEQTEAGDATEESETADSEPFDDYRTAFDPVSLLAQFGLGMGAGLTASGVGVGMMGLGAQIIDESSDSFVYIIMAPIGMLTVVVGAVPLLASPVINNLAVSLGGGELGGLRPMHAGTVFGGIIGAGVGLLGSASLVTTPNRFSRHFDFFEDPFRAGLIISLPYVTGMTLGAILGYHFSHRGYVEEQRRGRHYGAGKPPAVEPTIGAPMSADDSGWTFGARIRF